MERTHMTELYRWKSRESRKPLIIRGARQVGKTWLMKAFASEAYENAVYVNFDNNHRMKELFSADLNTSRIIMGLELYAGHKIDQANTLLIFDEVQESPQALASLKYFCEQAPEYHVICACSLLGVALHQGTSFLVGKVEFLDLYPLSFSEFLRAMGKEQFFKLLAMGDFQLITTFKQDYIDLLKQYCYVGGMPEVVLHFRKTRILTRSGEFKSKFWIHTSRIFQNTRPMMLSRASECYGTAFPHNLPKKIRNLSTALSKMEQEQRIMRWHCYGLRIAALYTRYTVSRSLCCLLKHTKI